MVFEDKVYRWEFFNEINWLTIFKKFVYDQPYFELYPVFYWKPCTNMVYWRVMWEILVD